MNGEILKAEAWLRDRIEAANLATSTGSEGAAEDAMRRIHSGLDLDLAELRDFLQSRGETAALMILALQDPVSLSRTFLMEGIVLGLRIAEQREKAEVAS